MALPETEPAAADLSPTVGHVPPRWLQLGFQIAVGIAWLGAVLGAAAYLLNRGTPYGLLAAACSFWIVLTLALSRASSPTEPTSQPHIVSLPMPSPPPDPPTSP